MFDHIKDLDEDGMLDGEEIKAAMDLEDAPDFAGEKFGHTMMHIIDEALIKNEQTFSGLPFPLSADRSILQQTNPELMGKFDVLAAEVYSESYDAALNTENNAAAQMLRETFPNGVDIGAEDMEGILSHGEQAILVAPEAPSTPTAPPSRTIPGLREI